MSKEFKKIKCPQCNTEIEDEKPTSTVITCMACASRWVRSQGAAIMPQEQGIEFKSIMKALKCPHCDGLILLKIPVIIEIKDKEITKKKAIPCPKCKGKKEIDGQPCDECNGIGAVSMKQKKDDVVTKEPAKK